MFSACDANLIINNGSYITEICQFKNCAIRAPPLGIHLGEMSDEQECARSVITMYPDALGATLTWEKDCYAEYGIETTPSSTNRCCLLVEISGNVLLCLKIFILVILLF